MTFPTSGLIRDGRTVAAAGRLRSPARPHISRHHTTAIGGTVGLDIQGPEPGNKWQLDRLHVLLISIDTTPQQLVVQLVRASKALNQLEDMAQAVTRLTVDAELAASSNVNRGASPSRSQPTLANQVRSCSRHSYCPIDVSCDDVLTAEHESLPMLTSIPHISTRSHPVPSWLWLSF